MPKVYKIRRTLQYNKKKLKVLKLILGHPGVRYKQVQRTTDLPNGSLSYILKKLENSGSIVVNRADNNRITAYYPNSIKANERRIIENLRNSVDKRIVQYLLKQGQSTFYNIVNHSNRAPSTVSWHLSKLKKGKLVTSTGHRGDPQAYKIINENIVSRILSKYSGKFVHSA